MSKRQRHGQTRRRRGHSSRVSSKRRLAAAGGLGLGATLALGGTAHATDFTVTNLNPNGPGSLAQAVIDSNNNPGADRVLFQSGLSGTISLTGGLLFVNDATQVLGPGADTITVTLDPGNNGYEVFNVSDGSPGTFSDVTISGLTLTGAQGYPTSPGGAIVSFERLTVSNVVITANHSQTEGGGIWAGGGGTLDVESSTISNNTATGYGGAIYANNADVTIQSSTLSGNVVGEDGAGVYSGSGGNLLAIQNSTIANNTVTAPNGDTGGGVFFCCGEGADRLSIQSSTISGNSTAGHGGGVYTFDNVIGGYRPSLSNTIVAGNTAVSAAPDVETLGPDGSLDAAFSLIGVTSGATINSTGPNLLGADPQLGPLASNGGTTQTMALPASSPAVDAGNTALTGDQRGSTRPFDFASTANAVGGNGADIGAFELAPSSCQGKAPTIIARSGQTTNGTPGVDVIVGTDKRDVIKAGRGKDIVCGRSGNDKITGGKGNDKVSGDNGKDKLSGQAGKDLLKGGKGKDKLQGGKGNDKLKGGKGRDKLIGGPGKDRLSGGPGKDVQKQ